HALPPDGCLRPAASGRLRPLRHRLGWRYRQEPWLPSPPRVIPGPEDTASSVPRCFLAESLQAPEPPPRARPHSDRSACAAPPAPSAPRCRLAPNQAPRARALALAPPRDAGGAA